MTRPMQIHGADLDDVVEAARDEAIALVCEGDGHHLVAARQRLHSTAAPRIPHLGATKGMDSAPRVCACVHVHVRACAGVRVQTLV